MTDNFFSSLRLRLSRVARALVIDRFCRLDWFPSSVTAPTFSSTWMPVVCFPSGAYRGSLFLKPDHVSPGHESANLFGHAVIFDRDCPHAVAMSGHPSVFVARMRKFMWLPRT
jgi:hypothetical protein